MSPEEYRSIRKKLGLTQAELAEKLGVSRRTIVKREGDKTITREAQIAISSLTSEK